MMQNVYFLPFHQLFEKQVEERPDAIALVYGEEKMTYGELNIRANQLASYLLENGVTKNRLVGIFFERSFELIISILAIFKAGCAYVPLDPEYPSVRLEYILNDTRLEYLLTHRHISGKLPASHAEVIHIDERKEQIEALPEGNPLVKVFADDLAYVIYTSGTTGLPKGVMIEHAGLANMADEQLRIFQMGSADRIIQLSSICFDASVFEIVLALRSGAELCLIPSSNKLVGLSLLHFLKKYRITCATIVPSVLELLPVEDLPDLKTIISAGEACTGELVNRWAREDRRFFNAYGPTETTVWATIEECHYGMGTPSIGVPIENTVAYLLDENLQETPVGVAGELYLGGVHVARGYWNNPKVTEDRFIAAPFHEHDISRLYKTGDFAKRRADGRIQFLGRSSHFVKIRGFRVAPSEIQDAISKHPAVRQSCVTGLGEEAHLKKLIAYVVLDEKKHATALELKAFLKQSLPEHMIPSQFVFLPFLPMMGNGKVDWNSLPKPSAMHPGIKASEGRNSLVEELRQLWCDIFRLDQVDVKSHFFDDLGGDSLNALDLMIRIEKKFNIELPIRMLFEAPTILAMAEVVYGYGHDQTAAARADSATKVDFREEVLLDSQTLDSLRERVHDENILLTGCTGFLGSFLLRELFDRTNATVYCLVRADSKQEGMQRILQTFRKYRISEYGLINRAVIVLGDLSATMIGLSARDFCELSWRIDFVYHCASTVNFVYPYHRLKPTNVAGTKEIIRLAASGKVKALHYVSSLAVYGSVGYFHHAGIPEDELEHYDSLHMGYAESKAVAEKLVKNAGQHGLPTYIYRLDDVIGHSETGVWNTNDFICRHVKGCIQMGLAPQLDIRMNALPVDFMARIIVHISRQESMAGKAFNIFNPHEIHHLDMFNFMSNEGYRPRQVPFSVWRNVLVGNVREQKDNALYPLIPLFTERYSEHQLTIPEMYEQQRRPKFSNVNTMQGLKDSGISFPKLDGRLFHRYVRYFIESGFLSAPPAD